MHVRHGSEKQVHRFPGLPEAFATIRPSSRSLSKKTKESYTLGSHWRHTGERFGSIFETTVRSDSTLGVGRTGEASSAAWNLLF